MYIVDTYFIFETAEDVAQHIVDNLDSDLYDEMLNECYGDVNICGYEYSAAYALEQIDPIAYRCGMSDYYDSLYSDILYELEMLDDGRFTDIYGFEIEHKEDEEEEEEEEEE